MNKYERFLTYIPELTYVYVSKFPRIEISLT